MLLRMKKAMRTANEVYNDNGTSLSEKTIYLLLHFFAVVRAIKIFKPQREILGFYWSRDGHMVFRKT